jgi:2-dehydropantoate 2-reductase
MKQITAEAMAVAQAAGVRLPDGDMVETVYQVGQAMSNAVFSTGQDIARGKRTEIDSLNGYLARRGSELEVAARVNETLFGAVPASPRNADLS